MELKKASIIVSKLTKTECHNLWRGCWLNVARFKVVAFVTVIASCGYDIIELFAEEAKAHGVEVDDYIEDPPMLI